jgi:hypothetical protein
MPIDAGDVVLTFLGDTTDLDKAFDKVSDQAAGAKEDLGPVGDAVGGIGDKFKTVGTAAEGAGAATSAASGEITTGATAAAGALGNVESATIGAAGATGKLAAGAAEAGVAVEGVSTIASVVGEVIAGAFAAGVVFLFIEALFHGISALEDLDAQAAALAAAWDKVDAVQKKVFEGLQTELLKAQLKVAELDGNHIEALRLRLQLVDETSLSHLENELDKIAAAADKAFKDKDLQPNIVQRIWGFNSAGEVSDEFQRIKQSVDTALNPRTPEAYDRALAMLNEELAKTQTKINDLSAKDKPVTIGGFTAPGIDPKALASYDALHVQIQKEIADVNASREANELEKKAADKTETKKSWADAATAAKQYADQSIQAARDSEKAQLAEIGQVKADRLKAFNEGKLGAGDLAVAEVKAANDSRVAHQTYLSAVVDAYTKAGLSAKAYSAQQDLVLQRVKDAEKAEKELADLRKQLAENEAKYKKLEADSWKATYDEITKATFAEQILAKVDPFTPQIKGVLNLENALKQIGVQGYLSLNQQLAATQKAEKLLNDAGIHEGQIWLQVQAAKLKAIIALQSAEKKSTADTVRELKQIEGELKKFGTASTETLKQSAQAWVEQGLVAAASASSVGEAAQAMAGSVLSALASYAIPKAVEQLALGFAAMSPVSPDFGHSGEHFASSAEWFAVAAAASAVGSFVSGSGGGGSSSKTEWTGGTGSSAASDNGPATQAQTAPTGGQNVPHLAEGGLVTAPTLAVVGDSRNGGRGNEAVIPLDNPEALQMIAGAIAGHLGGTGTNVQVTNHINGVISADKLTKVIKQMDRQISKRQSRLTSGNSFRITRRG